MILKRVVGAVGALAVAVLATLALASPASAHHNSVDVRSVIGDCGETVFYTAWAKREHLSHNAKLVVEAAGEVHVAPVGTELTVGPFETDREIIRWRIWGGGERDYDDPAVADLPALLEYLDRGGSPLDGDAPGVRWHELPVAGCVPPSPTPEPSPSVEPTPEPSAEPSVDPSATPSTDPSEPPAPGGGGGEELPVTGTSWVPLAVGVGVVSAVVGVVLAYRLRQKRVTFTA